MRILFCNIGWMEKYQGLNGNDKIIGGGAYVEENNAGHEVCNFHPVNGKVYGYVQTDGSIKLERIDKNINPGTTDGNSDNKSLDKVLVVWMAIRPKALGGKTVIVGWYRNTTVFKELQRFDKIPPLQRENDISKYLIEVAFKNATLLPVDARNFVIERAANNLEEGGPGQYNVWYADKVKNKPIIKRVLCFIRSRAKKTPANKGTKRASRPPDQERKAEVERAAIQLCCEHFEKLGYKVKSVEEDNKGWDLQAKKDKCELRIEVKGLSGPTFSVELTPNEYKAFSKKAEDYRLAVVVDALRQPKLSVCRYSPEQKGWVVETDGEEDRSLKIKTKESASISCS